MAISGTNGGITLTDEVGITSVNTDSSLSGSGTSGSALGINLTNANTWTGSQTITVSAPTAALTLTQTGSGNCLYIEDAGSDTTPYVIDGTGRVIHGNATLIAVGGANPQYALHGSTAGTSTGAFCNWQAAAGGPTLGFSKSRNATPGSFTVVTSGDSLGTLSFYGDDGSNITNAGGVLRFQVDGSAGSGSIPGRAIIATTSAGATAPSNRLEISNLGAIRFNTYGAGTVTSDSSGNLTITSDERMKDITGDFTRGLDSILGLEPKLYHWNEKSKLSQKELNAGFIAQNVKEFIPESIFENENGFYSMADRPITAALVNAIKELNNRIRQLEEK